MAETEQQRRDRLARERRARENSNNTGGGYTSDPDPVGSFTTSSDNSSGSTPSCDSPAPSSDC